MLLSRSTYRICSYPNEKILGNRHPFPSFPWRPSVSLLYVPKPIPFCWTVATPSLCSWPDDDHKLVSLQVRERADIEYGCKSTLGSLWVATGDSWSAAGGSVNVWKRRFTSLWGVGLLDLRRARDCWIKPTIGNSVSHSKCTDPMHLQTSSACNGLGTSYLQSKQSDSRIWQQRPSCLRPIHCSLHVGDQNIAETIANVITSLPFIVLGLQAPRQNLNAALYANSLIGVGIASSLYHSSRGQARRFLRWADYTMIATTTVCLSRAVRNENPRLLMVASTILLPFQPFMVSAMHTGLMEVAFARRALIKPELRMAHNLHTLSSLLGGALFVADDFFPETPYIHAAWHLAAAVGVGTCNKLLE
ncbi:unnamed protein product [Musa hybrid cultivar]